jgi:DNA-binding LacI/PurR family transcriptional regulator
MPSLRQVAERAQVSVTTASLVLNMPTPTGRVSDECAERVRRIAQEMGYAPNYHARSMRSGRAEMIAVAIDIGFSQPEGVPEITELSIPYFAQIVGGIEVALRGLGYQMTIVGPSPEQRAPERGWQGIRDRRFDGMIIQGSAIHERSLRFMAQSASAPIIAIDFDGPTNFPVVHTDVSHGLSEAMEHLANLGHQDVLWIGLKPDARTGRIDDREQQFIRLAWKLGLRGEALYTDHPIVLSAAETASETQLAMAHASMRDRLAQPRRFTAVVAYNDPMAIGAVYAMQDAGLKVPSDVSVIGHDNWESRYCRPALTSVDLMLPEVSRHAVHQLIEMTNAGRTPEHRRSQIVQIPSKLVHRQSVAAVSKPS